MKSDLQVRAQELAQRYSSNPRKAILIEFAGVPKAGKTTILNAIYSFLKRCGFRPEIVVERASICPIRDKKHHNFNIWTACTTLSQILEKTQEPPMEGDPNILILDRGLFDSLCWLSIMEKTGRILKSDKAIVENFLLLDEWKKRINIVILMTVSPDVAMKREGGLLPVEGEEGSIMNRKMLQLILDTNKDTVKNLRGHFRIFEIDTSDKSDNPENTATIVATRILDAIEEQIREDILCLPRQEVVSQFDGLISLNPDKAQLLIRTFLTKGEFLPRENIEKNSEYVQAIPVVIVRNNRGEVLQLRRREKTEDNPLHEKLVIWAGGHVRIEDKLNGQSIIQCIVRELKEELRLNIAGDDLVLLGAVYSDFGKQTSNHIALVYEWRTTKEDIDIALCTAEFFERRGTSLSGKFVNMDLLIQQMEQDKDQEPWTQAIIFNFLRPLDIGQKRMFST